MTDNYVALKIKAADDARPDLTDLKARLEELGRKRETAKVDVNDKDAVAKSLAMDARLASLGERVARPRITMAGAARAAAEVAALDAEMGKSEEKATGLRSRLLALGSGASAIGGLGDVFGVFNSEAGMASKIMSGFSLATGLAEAPMAGLIVGVGGLASGLAAAGAGLGAFGIVAKSVFTQASTAAAAYAAAQVKLSNATTSAQRNSALLAERDAMKGLSPPVRALAVELGNLHGMWQKFVNAAAPGVVGVLSQGIGILSSHFAVLGGFLPPVEAALSGLMAQLSRGLDSKGFASFIQVLQANSGPAITKIGEAIGHVVVGLGGIITAFMPFAQIMLGGIDKITAKFASWGSTLTQHSGFKALTAMAEQDMPMVIEVAKNLGAALLRVGSAMTGLSTASNSSSLLKLAVPLSEMVDWLTKANPMLLNMGLYALAAGGAIGKMRPAFQGISAGIGLIKGAASGLQDLQAGFSNSAAAASAATGIWGTVGGKIATAVTAVKGWSIWSSLAAAGTRMWTAVQAAFDVVMDANPIVLVVVAIAALVGAIVLVTMHSKAFRDFWKAAWHDIASVFDRVRHEIAAGFGFITRAASAAFGWVKDHWPLLLAILTGPIGLAVYFIASHWKQITAGAAEMFHDVVSFFEQLPHRILSATGNLGTLLWNAGVSIISGLLGGLMQKFNDVKNFVSGIASWIGDHKGPLAADAVLLRPHGRVIMGGLVSGLADGMPALTGQLARTTAAISGGVPRGGYGAYGGAGRGGQLEIILRMAQGSLLKAMQAEVRSVGGDPLMFTKKVAYRSS